MSEEFLLPGFWQVIGGADESALHQGGLDQGGLYSGHVSTDPVDSFGNEPGLDEDLPQDWRREQLPQFGPPFVGYVVQEFERLDRRLGQVDKALARWSYEPVTHIFVGSMNTDNTGAINRSITDKAAIYEPPPGFTLALHRFSIFAAGNITFGTPYTAAGSWWELRVNDEPIMGNSMISGQGQLPIVATYGTRDAPRIRDGEVLSLFMSGGPTNRAITVKGQGTLERQPES